MLDLTADAVQTREAIVDVASQLAAMIRPPADMSERIPKADWSVGEAAAHLAYANRVFADLARGKTVVHGDGTPESLAAANADALARFPERSGDRSANQIQDAARELAELLEAGDEAMEIDTPMGRMQLPILGSYVLAHMVMHGVAIAKALGQANPMRRSHLQLMLPFFAYAMPKVLDQNNVGNLNACYLMHFRGGPDLALMFDDGELTVASAPTRRVDCHVLADPVAFVLVVTRLQSQYTAIAKGQLLTWGRKPWLALRLVGFFNVP